MKRHAWSLCGLVSAAWIMIAAPGDLEVCCSGGAEITERWRSSGGSPAPRAGAPAGRRVAPGRAAPRAPAQAPPTAANAGKICLFLLRFAVLNFLYM